jgi:putative endonuclease
MKGNRLVLGKWGENKAAEYLVGKGYQILERNVRTPYGEIDLIALWPGKNPSKDMVAFVEVKTRETSLFGNPEESVNLHKQARLLASAQHYIQEHPEFDGDWRIDVIAIRLLNPGKPPEIIHFENAIGL